MMHPHAWRDKVVLTPPIYSTAHYLKPLVRLDEAQRNLEAVLSDLPSSELHDFHDAVEAAEADVEDLFRLELSVEEAEKVHRRLGAAILNAKAFRGDFARSWVGENE